MSLRLIHWRNYKEDSRLSEGYYITIVSTKKTIAKTKTSRLFGSCYNTSSRGGNHYPQVSWGRRNFTIVRNTYQRKIQRSSRGEERTLTKKQDYISIVAAAVNEIRVGLFRGASENKRRWSLLKESRNSVSWKAARRRCTLDQNAAAVEKEDVGCPKNTSIPSIIRKRPAAIDLSSIKHAVYIANPLEK